ncbi:MAG TPA: hypothetical protein VK578_04350 [Edaphobacter sp.]|nr:hypothetical protein [Edaphobacter sp.]
MIRKHYLVPAVVAVILCLVWLIWHARSKNSAPQITAVPSTSSAKPTNDSTTTTVYAHNLVLLKGPVFRVYIRWLRGEMVRTHPETNPSFDDPESFLFLIQKGVIHANLGDIGNFLNASTQSSFPLKNVTITGEGNNLKMSGTLHKGVPLPVEMLATVSSTSDGRIHLSVTKISALKIPVKALLGGLHIDIKDIMGADPMPGVEVSGNDLFFDTTKLLPPPHIRGHPTSVTLAKPDLVLVYGNSDTDEAKLAQWHNFLRLSGGTVDFGKLTMRNADLTLIDASDDAWFNLDLVNYQAQLVNGFSRITPKSGLEIFMPNLDGRNKKPSASITLNWLQNRNLALPPGVPPN